jgi:FG-GAP-like repeat
VLLGDGRGGFTPAPASPVKALDGSRAHTHEVVLGDVNLDGALDLLSTHVNDSKVSVLLGDGKGAFAPAPASPLQTSRGPYDALVLRDFDGDRIPDLAMPNIHGNKLDVMRGDGKGGFAHAAGSPFAVRDRPIYAGAADVNGDGKPDLLATHDDVGLLTVLLNDGNGSFRPAAPSPVRTSQVGLGFDAGDLNGDGIVDLVMGVMSRGNPFILYGDGKGGFREGETLTLPGENRPEYAVLSDLNRDRIPDILVSNYRPGNVVVLLGRTRGR